MLINEVCISTGLTKKAIDYYEQKRIISPKVMGNGYREFSEIDIDKLQEVAVYRALGLSVSDIKDILESKFPKEELKRCVVKKNLENELSNKQRELLERLSVGGSIQSINEEINELNKKKSLKEKILEMFPGFYGRFFINHFSRFLLEPMETEYEIEAYKTIVNFLDNVEPLNISDDIMDEFEGSMDFWTDEKLEEVEKEKQKSIENPEAFLKEQAKIIEEYQALKESKEYKDSSFSKIMEAIKQFGEESGYNDIFIPAMRNLSPVYEEYYQNLIIANNLFIEKYPDYK